MWAVKSLTNISSPGIRAENNVLEAPHEGWGDTVYIVTQVAGSSRRRRSGSGGGEVKRKKKNKLLEDLIVFGLPLTLKNEDLKGVCSYFGLMGQLKI